MIQDSDKIISEIENIQQRLELLKKKLSKRDKKQKVKLEGLWDGWSVPDDFFKEAKLEIFKTSYNIK
ncbi:hypothetical protein JXI42_01390 [bacterium]|nr:hypothetical protein [bacterium]